MTAARPEFQDGRVKLRAPETADVEERVRLGNSPIAARGYGVDPENAPEMTRAAVERWFTGVSDDPTFWIIEYDGRMVGSARLWNLDPFDHHAEYSIGILDPTLHGMGIGTSATRLLLGYAFRTLGLHRVWLRVLSDNTCAVHCYTRCGFKLEGTEREAVWMDGSWHDRLLMGNLEADFLGGSGAP